MSDDPNDQGLSRKHILNAAYHEEEREMTPFCRDQGTAVTPFSTLARGVTLSQMALNWRTALA